MTARPALLLTAFTLLLTAAPAGAQTVPPPHRGETGQGKDVTVRTDTQRRVARVTIGWTATCRRGRVRSTTALVPPRRATTANRFAVTGAFTLRQKGGVRTRVRLVVEGSRDTAVANGGDRWTGTIAGTAVVRRRGKAVDRCTLRKTAWSAARPGATPTAPGAVPAPPTPPTPPAQAPGAPGPAGPPGPGPGSEPREVRAASWAFDMTGDPGDYVADSRRWVHAPPERFVAEAGSSEITMRVADWYVAFAAPAGQQLVAGTRYANAGNYPFQGSNAGVSISGNGRGCGYSTGEFTVHEMAYDVHGGVARFRASFVQYCDGSTAAARGTVEFTAAAP